MSQPVDVNYQLEVESYVVETDELVALNAVLAKLAESRGWPAMQVLAVADAWCRQTGAALGVLSRSSVEGAAGGSA